MTVERFSNQASTTLFTSVGTGDLSISVQATTNFPGSPEFRIRIGQELMLVTGVSGTTWTVTRGIEGTTPASHAPGSIVVAVLTSGALTEMRAEIEAEIPSGTIQTTDPRLADDRTASGIRTETTVVAISSATAPTPGQVLTATSGTAADWKTVPTPPTITSHGSAAAGDVVRLVSAEVLAQALADSTSHASSLIGVWNGVTPVSFSTQPVVNFDSSPIVGAPCYVSASVAGALTCTIPGVGYVSVPQDLLVLEDKSVGTAYAARVGINKAMTGSLSARDDFKRYAAQLTGMNLAKAEFFGSDFTASELQDTGTGPMLPLTFGTWTQPCLPSSQYSSIYTNTAGTVLSVKKVLPAANLATQKWAMSVRFRQDVAGYELILALRRANVDGVTFTETAQVGFSAYVGHSTQLLFGAGNFDPADGVWDVRTPTAAYGTIGVTWHQGVMYSKGDGNIYCNLDNAGVLSLPIAPSAATGMVELWCNTNSLQMDWLYLVNERVDY